jgi:hypothetical protein
MDEVKKKSSSTGMEDENDHNSLFNLKVSYPKDRFE